MIGNVNQPALGDVSTLTTMSKIPVEAINEIDADATAALNRIGTAASVSGTLGTAIDTDGTLKAGAVDSAGVIANGIITATQLATALLNAIDQKQHNYQWYTNGATTWNQTTSVLTIRNGRVYHNTTAVDAYTYLPTTLNIDFSALKAATKSGVAYFSGIVPGQFQNYSAVAPTVERLDQLTHSLLDKDVLVLAMYNYEADSCLSPFVAAEIERGFLKGSLLTHMSNMSVLTSGDLYWKHYEHKLYSTQPIYLYNGGAAAPVLITISSPAAGQPLIDFSSVSGSYAVAYIDGYVPGVSMTVTPATDIHVASYASPGAALYESGTIVLAVFNPASSQRPGIQGLLANYVAGSDRMIGRVARPEAWWNRYPGLAAKFPLLRAKKLGRTGHVRIVLWGESVFADATKNASAVADATVTPPSMESMHIGWHIWQRFGMDQGVYRRHDYPAFFSLTGSWTSINYDTIWDDAPAAGTIYRNYLTNFCADTNAAFSWTLAAGDGNTGCNLIYRTDVAGDAAATVAVAEGVGYLEFWDGNSWEEAHGATINMLEIDDGAGYGNTRLRRFQMRKTVAHEDDACAITIGKNSADSDRLLFWGVELYDAKNGQVIVQVDNRARGSHNIVSLANYIVDDCTDGKASDGGDGYPDLVLWQFTSNTIQAYGDTKSVQEVVDLVHDQVWGDRGGATNANALFKMAQVGGSGTWDNFEVVIVIPHFRREDFSDSTQLFKRWASGATTQEYYEAIKQFVIGRGDVGMVDMSSVSLRECDALPEFSNYYTFVAGTGGATGKGITSGYVHLNDNGVQMYCKHIVPVFDFNTL